MDLQDYQFTFVHANAQNHDPCTCRHRPYENNNTILFHKIFTMLVVVGSMV